MITNTNEFKAELARHGDTLTRLAQKLNISTVSLSLKANGRRDFSQSEIARIKEIYGLNNERIDVIFFNSPVSCQDIE